MESAFAKDENLVLLHPRIQAKPSYKLREEEFELKKQIAKDLKEQVEERTAREREAATKTKEQNIALIDQRISEFDNLENQRN